METIEYRDACDRIVDEHPGKWVLIETTEVDVATSTSRAARLIGAFDTEDEAWRALAPIDRADRIFGVHYSPTPEERDRLYFISVY